MKSLLFSSLLIILSLSTQARVINFVCESTEYDDETKVSFSVDFDDKPELTDAHISLPRNKTGFELRSGTLLEVGYKSNRYWMELSLRDRSQNNSDTFVIRFDRQSGQIEEFFYKDAPFKATVYTIGARGSIWLRGHEISCIQD